MLKHKPASTGFNWNFAVVTKVFYIIQSFVCQAQGRNPCSQFLIIVEKEVQNQFAVVALSVVSDPLTEMASEGDFLDFFYFYFFNIFIDNYIK